MFPFIPFMYSPYNRTQCAPPLPSFSHSFPVTRFSGSIFVVIHTILMYTCKYINFKYKYLLMNSFTTVRTSIKFKPNLILKSRDINLM